MNTRSDTRKPDASGTAKRYESLAQSCKWDIFSHSKSAVHEQLPQRVVPVQVLF